MRKVIWYVLAAPLLPLAFLYGLLRVVQFLGESAEKATDKMYDWQWRYKYLSWRNKKFG